MIYLIVQWIKSRYTNSKGKQCTFICFRIVIILIFDLHFNSNRDNLHAHRLARGRLEISTRFSKQSNHNLMVKRKILNRCIDRKTDK